MVPRIEMSSEKKLVGNRLTMSFSNYRIAELWQSFMPRRKEIVSKLTNDIISLALYSPTHFSDYSPVNEFERWATVEVSDFDNVPQGMETLVVPGGSYAVFNYRGLSTDNSAFQYIFKEWLPDSGFALDDRPHFEVLGSKYKNNDPTSEEEIWIPIKHILP